MTSEPWQAEQLALNTCLPARAASGEIESRGGGGWGGEGGGGVVGGLCLASTANDGDQYKGNCDAERCEPTYSCAFVRHIRVPFASTAVVVLNKPCVSRSVFPRILLMR